MLNPNEEVQEAAQPSDSGHLILKEEPVWKWPGSLPYGGTVTTTSRQYTVPGQMPEDGIFRFLKSNH